MESSSPAALELLSQTALAQEHDARELSKLPAKKRLTQLKAQQHQQQLQQNAILQNSTTNHSSISIIPINNPTPINSSNNNISMKLDRPEPMDQDDDEEINVHDDSPLDMRITKHDSDDSVRPSVIRRAPSFKETNSPSDPSSTCDPFIDEHFRRSLGTDYDLILRKKQLEQEQKQRMIEEQISLQQQQQQQQQQQILHAQNILKLKHHKKHQIHQHHQAMLSIQQENQLPIQQSPIPIVPTPINLQQQQPPVVQQLQKQVIITEHSDANEMSVDDHFAKALGDTWKKIQNESK